MSRPWESLAGFNGAATICTCSDAQLDHVGCECRAEQNLPATCNFQDCGNYLRTQEQISNQMCSRCAMFRAFLA